MCINGRVVAVIYAPDDKVGLAREAFVERHLNAIGWRARAGVNAEPFLFAYFAIAQR
jgi:hypothetical protein